MKKTRIDKLLVDRGLVESRERARALIMAGDVLVGGAPVEKAGAGVAEDADVALRRPPHPYVGRGGVKLEGALEGLDLAVDGLTCADIGSSTGGFTDCLLRRGAARIYAIDVDTSQLDWRLRQDPRVRLIEGNARYLAPDGLGESVDLAVVDVSFISLTKILPAAAGILGPPGRCLALVKPQFELGRRHVGKGGIVADPDLHARAVRSVVEAGPGAGLRYRATCPSPITGKDGNREFFILFEKS